MEFELKPPKADTLLSVMPALMSKESSSAPPIAEAPYVVVVHDTDSLIPKLPMTDKKKELSN